MPRDSIAFSNAEVLGGVGICQTILSYTRGLLRSSQWRRFALQLSAGGSASRTIRSVTATVVTAFQNEHETNEAEEHSQEDNSDNQ